MLSVAKDQLLMNFTIGLCLRNNGQFRSLYRERQVIRGASTLIHRHVIVRRVTSSVQGILHHGRFFFVARFSGPLNGLTREILISVSPRYFGILASVHLAKDLTGDVFTSATRAFKRRVVTVRVIFTIAVDVSANALHGSVFPSGQFIEQGVGAKRDFRRSTNVVSPFFPGYHVRSRLVFRRNGRATGQNVPNALSRSIRYDVGSFCANASDEMSVHCHRVVIIVDVGVRLRIQVTYGRFLAVFMDVSEIRSTGHVERRRAPSQRIAGQVSYLGSVFEEIFGAIQPVFRVSIRNGPPFSYLISSKACVNGVLFKDLAGLFHRILVETLTGRICRATADHFSPIWQGVAVRGTRRFRLLSISNAFHPKDSTLRNFGLAIQSAYEYSLRAIRARVGRYLYGTRLLVHHGEGSQYLFPIARNNVRCFCRGYSCVALLLT